MAKNSGRKNAASATADGGGGGAKVTSFTSRKSLNDEPGMWEGGVVPVHYSSRLGAEGDSDDEDRYDPYARDKLHGKYWRTLQTIKPVRMTK